ncbi:MAG: hypothetical protein LIR50_15015 [Bacillota bacterium]|nr:hypothetical protein [Bacillota bacterium]
MIKNYLNIIRFIENYGMLTAKQAGKIFCNDKKYPTLQSNVRLSTLKKKKILKSTICTPSREFAYYIDKKPNYHKKLLIDLYAELVSLGIEVIDFRFNKFNFPIRVFPDGFLLYKFNGHKYAMFIEIDFTHEPSNERYIELYKTSYVQDTIGGFPLIVRVNNKNRKDICDIIEVIYIDFDLSNLTKKLLC